MCQARAVECNEQKEPSTMEITTVGLDIAKRVFQLHGVDAAGRAVLRRKLQRSEVLAFFDALPPCLVGIEACGTAHYWAREIRELGHEVRLMPPTYVAPYVKRGKTDAADLPQSKSAMGRLCSIDRRKRRQALAGSCGSTSGRAGSWVIQATEPSPATSAMRQAFSGAKSGAKASSTCAASCGLCTTNTISVSRFLDRGSRLNDPMATVLRSNTVAFPCSARRALEVAGRAIYSAREAA